MKCSIIVPCYNVSKYLEEFFQHIPNTTIFEFIFINDGSTDDTLIILKKLLSYKQLTYKLIDLKTNVGISMAIYIATKNITGEWWGRLDPDDIPCSNYFSEIPKYLNNNHRIIRFSYFTFQDSEYICSNKLQNVHWYDYKKVAWGWSCIFNLKYIKLNVTGLEFIDDLERFATMTMKNNWKGKKEVFIPINLMGYRQRPDSLSHTEEITIGAYLEYKRIHKLYRKNKFIKFSFKKCIWIYFFWLQERKMKKNIKVN